MLPFGLPLAALRERGICILAYLDHWALIEFQRAGCSAPVFSHIQTKVFWEFSEKLTDPESAALICVYRSTEWRRFIAASLSFSQHTDCVSARISSLEQRGDPCVLHCTESQSIFHRESRGRLPVGTSQMWLFDGCIWLAGK